MAYEKPELITLSLASTAVRTGSQEDSNPSDGKISNTAEVAGQPADTVNSTSSTGSAYEADE